MSSITLSVTFLNFEPKIHRTVHSEVHLMSFESKKCNENCLDIAFGMLNGDLLLIESKNLFNSDTNSGE